MLISNAAAAEDLIEQYIYTDTQALFCVATPERF